MIAQKTHDKINENLSGELILLKEGYSKVKLQTTSDMITDESGLIHGGFIFSLADYSAMLAVNHPNVVLGGANVRFLKPVVRGETIIAEGKIEKREGKKHTVQVNVNRGEEVVFKGSFTCFILESHVLSKDKKD